MLDEQEAQPEEEVRDEKEVLTQHCLEMHLRRDLPVLRDRSCAAHHSLVGISHHYRVQSAPFCSSAEACSHQGKKKQHLPKQKPIDAEKTENPG